ncbi:LppU/SCO3897 family protein [Micromonospora sp. NPDC004336]
MIIGLVVMLLLCPCLGIAGWAVWQSGDEDEPVITAPTTSASAAPSTGPTGEPSAGPTSAEPSPSEDDDDAFAKGDCVVNDGTATDAELRKVPCGPNTYEVLLRIPGTTDGDRCKTRAPESTANYVHNNSINALDYVLCLKKR